MRQHPLQRVRLAFMILSPVILMTAVSVVVTLVILANLGPVADAGTEAGLARIGDDLALVVVADGAAEVAATRRALANWGLLAPAAVLVGGAFIAWWVSGSVQRRIDDATRSIDVAAEKRHRDLQEVVHELRTPLAVIGTNLELTAIRTGQDSHLDAAQRAVTRMSRTVNDLAGHGRLAVETDNEPASLGEIAEAGAYEHVALGRTRGIYVRVSNAGPVTVENVDPAAVRTVVGNLMSNAMRFAPKGSVVGIDWGSHGDWAWLAVSDQGPGVARSDHARIFERGWQGSHDRNLKQGSGLGMTIARQLTEAQGGRVTVDAEEGGGATFVVWLPRHAEASPDGVIAIDGIHALVRPWLDELAGV